VQVYVQRVHTEADKRLWKLGGSKGEVFVRMDGVQFSRITTINRKIAALDAQRWRC